jgi:hypothetical protein
VFRLALVSHLLFLYSQQLDVATHIASVLELLRVAEEVRLFPLVTLGRRWSPHVEPVRLAVEAAGHVVEIVEVPYEFRRIEGLSGSQMMRVVRRGETHFDPSQDR